MTRIRLLFGTNFVLRKQQVKNSKRKNGVEVVWEKLNDMDVIYIADELGKCHLLKSFIKSNLPSAQKLINASARQYYHALHEITYHETSDFDRIIVFPDGHYET